KTLAALAQIPTVVAPAHDAVDFLPAILPDIARPQVAGFAIEAEAPRVSEAEGVDLGAAALRHGRTTPRRDRATRRRERAARRVRVVGDDAVRTLALLPIDVDAQHGAQQGLGVLPVAERIGRRSAVAAADVEVAVRAKREVTAVVIFVGLRHLEQHHFTPRIEDVG